MRQQIIIKHKNNKICYQLWRVTIYKISRHAPSLELVEPQTALTLCVIEHAVISTRIKILTIGAILVQVDALWLRIAAGHHLAQRRIFIRKVLTRIGAVFTGAALDLWVIQTLLRLYVKQHRVLTELDHESSVHTFIIPAAAFRINESIFVQMARTFRRAWSTKIYYDNKLMSLSVWNVVRLQSELTCQSHTCLSCR